MPAPCVITGQNCAGYMQSVRCRRWFHPGAEIRRTNRVEACRPARELLGGAVGVAERGPVPCTPDPRGDCRIRRSLLALYVKPMPPITAPCQQPCGFEITGLAGQPPSGDIASRRPSGSARSVPISAVACAATRPARMRRPAANPRSPRPSREEALHQCRRRGLRDFPRA